METNNQKPVLHINWWMIGAMVVGALMWWGTIELIIYLI